MNEWYTGTDPDELRARWFCLEILAIDWDLHIALRDPFTVACGEPGLARSLCTEASREAKRVMERYDIDEDGAMDFANWLSTAELSACRDYLATVRPHPFLPEDDGELDEEWAAEMDRVEAEGRLPEWEAGQEMGERQHWLCVISGLCNGD